VRQPAVLDLRTQLVKGLGVTRYLKEWIGHGV
jgi:hypothetical protein